MGFFWQVLSSLFAKPPAVAGEPIANLFFSYEDRRELNGALFKLDKRVGTPDRAMGDEELGKKLWAGLVLLTELMPDTDH